MIDAMPPPPRPASPRPLIGVLADLRGGPLPYHHVMDKYVDAVRRGAGGLPLLIPPPPEHDEGLDAEAAVDALDALLLPGSRSDVDPTLYGAPPADPGNLDRARDRAAVALIRAAVARGVPVLGICRGFQELNVAFGGTLDRAVHERPGRLDHREDPAEPEEVRYAPAHEAAFAPGGLLHAMAGAGARVNSLHAQGVARLAPGLAEEARSPDGVIEAARVADARAFALGVQWHPEWRHAEDRVGRALFEAFGEAARARMSARATRRPAAEA